MTPGWGGPRGGYSRGVFTQKTPAAPLLAVFLRTWRHTPFMLGRGWVLYPSALVQSRRVTEECEQGVDRTGGGRGKRGGERVVAGDAWLDEAVRRAGGRRQPVFSDPPW